MENKGTVQGVGYLNGEKPWKNRQYEYEYELWSGMISRCYGKGKDSGRTCGSEGAGEEK